MLAESSQGQLDHSMFECFRVQPFGEFGSLGPFEFIEMSSHYTIASIAIMP